SHHHLKVIDQAVVVDVDEVATIDRHAGCAGDPGLELQRVVTAAGIVDFADIAKVFEDPQHAAQDRRGDRLADVGLEGHRAGEYDVVGEQGLDGRFVAFFDCLAERVGSGHGAPRIVNLL